MHEPICAAAASYIRYRRPQDSFSSKVARFDRASSSTCSCKPADSSAAKRLTLLASANLRSRIRVNGRHHRSCSVIATESSNLMGSESVLLEECTELRLEALHHHCLRREIATTRAAALPILTRTKYP